MFQVKEKLVLISILLYAAFMVVWTLIYRFVFKYRFVFFREFAYSIKALFPEEGETQLSNVQFIFNKIENILFIVQVFAPSVLVTVAFAVSVCKLNFKPNIPSHTHLVTEQEARQVPQHRTTEQSKPR